MKVYFDKNIIWNWPRCPFLNPILWKYDQQIWWYNDEQCSEWTSEGKKYLEYTSNPKNCDYFVYSKNFSLDDYSDIIKYVRNAQKYNKKVIIFGIDDMDIPYNIPNSIIFRTSFSKWHKWEYWMPCFPKDLWKSIQKTASYNENNISISYCWYIWYNSWRTKIIYYILLIKSIIFKNTVLKRILFNFHKHDLYFIIACAWLWRFYRQKMHEACKKLEKYKYNYIIRHTNTNPTDNSKIKTSYIDNILDNTFPIIIRWSWNYSFRLYEVMSLWKIPVFIDTNCVLPFEDQIDYKELFIWVPFEDLDNIESYIDIYISKNQDKIKKIQNKIREIYDDYLTMKWFYFHIIKILENHK